MGWVDYVIIGLMLVPPVFVLICVTACWIADTLSSDRRNK